MNINKQAVIATLGSPIAYYVTFAKVAGDVCAGVLLSQFFYWHGKGANVEEWIYKTQPEIEEETGLTRKNQETARRHLRELGILEERLAGVPAKLHYRLNIERLFELIDQRYPDNQASPNPTNKIARSGQTGTPDSDNLSIYTKTTTENTTKIGVAAQPPAPAPTKEKKPRKTTAAYTNPDTGVSTSAIMEEYKNLLMECEPSAVFVFSQEAAAALALAKNGWTPAHVAECYRHMKKDAFWKSKHLSLWSLAKQIGAYHARNKRPTQPVLTLEAQGIFLDSRPIDPAEINF
jgi:hypothetical protein